jgi:hypothetical protein
LGNRTAVARSFGVTGLPGVLRAEFVYQAYPHSIKFVFSRGVSPSLGMEDVVVTHLATGAAVFPLGYRYDPIAANQNLEETATFTFDGVLPDGNYRVTLNRAGIVDGQNNTLSGGNVFDFFVLAGDANRDRRVDFNDLAIMAQNYNTGGKSYVQGNFDYDQGGIVGFNDLALLAQRYNTSLSPVSAGTVAVATQLPEGSSAERRQTANSVFNATMPVQRKKPTKPIARLV